MPQRPVEWAGNTFSDQILPAQGLSADYVVIDADDGGPSPFSFEHYTKPTITRCVGRLVFQLNASTADPDINYELRYMVALICADEDKPSGNPASEFGHPWMWMDFGFLHRPSVGAKVSGVGPAEVILTADSKQSVYGTPQVHHVLDIRTMRKVNRDCELRVVVRTMFSAGAIAPRLHGFIRCLIKE